MRQLATDDIPRRVRNPWHLGVHIEVWILFVGFSLAYGLVGAGLAPLWWLRLLALPFGMVPGLLTARAIARRLDWDRGIGHWMTVISSEIRSTRPTKTTENRTVAPVAVATFLDQRPSDSRVTAIDASIFTSTGEPTA
jgi:hypothetical protein